MKRPITILLSMLFLIGTVSCTPKDDTKSHQSAPTNIIQKQQSSASKQIEKKRTGSSDNHSGQPVKRKYKFPSMMVKEDMYHEDFITPDRKTSLRCNLIVKGWEATGDDYGRTFLYTSPEISYAELKEFLHFNDDDVTYVTNVKPGDPQAVIRTDWLTCNITFINKIYNGKDPKVKLKAVVIDIEQKSYSDKETSYRKNRGIIRRVLDFFYVVHK